MALGLLQELDHLTALGAVCWLCPFCTLSFHVAPIHALACVRDRSVTSRPQMPGVVL